MLDLKKKKPPGRMEIFHGLGMRCGLGNKLYFPKNYCVSYERFDGGSPQSAAPTRDIIWIYERFDEESPQSAAPTRDVIWMLSRLRLSWSEPWIGSTQIYLT